MGLLNKTCGADAEGRETVALQAELLVKRNEMKVSVSQLKQKDDADDEVMEKSWPRRSSHWTRSSTRGGR